MELGCGRVATLVAFTIVLALPLSGTAETVTPAASQSPVTIDFDGLSGTNGSPFSIYAETGFKVRARPAGSWLVGTNGGNPAPYIWFNTTAGTKSTKSVGVSYGKAQFAFKSVDIYSSITRIPYRFRGMLNGMTKYVVTGIVPNTFGSFATVSNPNVNVPIDELWIYITNPLTVCCQNPEGIDNIVVIPAASP